MKRKQIKNIGASVLSRLLNLSKEQNIEFNRLLVLYVQESFLYRLSISKYKDRFILKGGVLFYGVYLQKARPTKDLDFLLRNISNNPTEYLVAVKEILSIDVPDGVVYDIDNISMTSITEAADYK